MHSAETEVSEPSAPQRERQPAGLWTLSSIAVWERLSFYGLQVILAYYVYYSVSDGGLGLPLAAAVAITGAYGGSVYLMQPVGAWLADRLVPARTLVFAGLGIIMAGHITLAAVPGLIGLLTGLTLIVLGSGALLPNLWASLNLLYEEGSPRRDFGFTLYYVGVLVGALFGPIATGFLQIKYGFHIGFLAAAFGILVGLAAAIVGRNTLPVEARLVPNPLPRSSAGKILLIVFAGILVIGLLVIFGALTAETVNYFVLGASFAVAIGYFLVMHRSRKVEPQERRRVLAYIPLFIVAVLFWTLILQLFTTFAIYADTRVDLSLGGVTVPAAYISSFQVITAILMGPFIAAAGQRLARRNPKRVAGPATKLAFSMGLLTITFALFATLSLVIGQKAPIPLAAVIVGMIFFGIAEVSFAPTLFSVSGQMAPKVFNAQMMALTGLTLAAGASLSGFAGQLYVSIGEPSHFGLMAILSAISMFALLGVRGLWAKVGVL